MFTKDKAKIAVQSDELVAALHNACIKECIEFDPDNLPDTFDRLLQRRQTLDANRVAQEIALGYNTA